MAAGTARFTWNSFLWRWAVALALVLGTFNPTDYSYFNWVVQGGAGPVPVKVLAGVVLLIVYVVYLRAAWFSLGALGFVLLTAFFAALVWVLVDFGLLDISGGSALTWVILVALATILAIGFSWSKLKARLTGQVDVDDVED